jgi:hypothetical protein
MVPNPIMEVDNLKHDGWYKGFNDIKFLKVNIKWIHHIMIKKKGLETWWCSNKSISFGGWSATGVGDFSFTHPTSGKC